MTLVVVPPKHIQETLDHYIGRHGGVMLLKPGDCGKRVALMKIKYNELSKKQLKRLPYISMILNLQRQQYPSRDKTRPNKMMLYYPGVPCFKCLQMIPIDSKCVSKKGGNYAKSYHIECARQVNLI